MPGGLGVAGRKQVAYLPSRKHFPYNTQLSTQPQGGIQVTSAAHTSKKCQSIPHSTNRGWQFLQPKHKAAVSTSFPSALQKSGKNGGCSRTWLRACPRCAGPYTSPLPLPDPHLGIKKQLSGSRRLGLPALQATQSVSRQT